jgi:hypothetical protein
MLPKSRPYAGGLRDDKKQVDTDALEATAVSTCLCGEGKPGLVTKQLRFEEAGLVYTISPLFVKEPS